MSSSIISLRGQALIIIMLAVAGIVMVTLLAFMLLLQAIGPFLAGTLAAVIITVIAVVASRLIHNRLVKIL